MHNLIPSFGRSLAPHKTNVGVFSHTGTMVLFQINDLLCKMHPTLYTVFPTVGKIVEIECTRLGKTLPTATECEGFLPESFHSL